MNLCRNLLGIVLIASTSLPASAGSFCISCDLFHGRHCRDCHGGDGCGAQNYGGSQGYAPRNDYEPRSNFMPAAAPMVPVVPSIPAMMVATPAFAAMPVTPMAYSPGYYAHRMSGPPPADCRQEKAEECAKRLESLEKDMEELSGAVHELSLIVLEIAKDKKDKADTPDE